MPPGDDASHGPAQAARAGWGRLRAAHPALAAALPGLVLTAAGLLAFAVLLDSVQERDDFTVFDEPVLAWLVAGRTDVLTAVLLAITFVTGPSVLPALVTIGAVVWAVRLRDAWRPGVLVGALVVSSLISLAVKSGVARPRPPLMDQYVPGAETTHAFPSGHTIGIATLCLVGGYLIWVRSPSRRGFVVWALVTVAATGAVGLSRLYLGYHFVTDVAGAVALAVAVLGVVVAVHQVHRLRRRSRSPQAPPAPPGTPPGRRR
jgi:undecaprenyl-diphosphatase